jgi:urease
MKFNDAQPRMHVDPESYVVKADGEVCEAEPSETLPLTQQYFVF